MDIDDDTYERLEESSDQESEAHDPNEAIIRNLEERIRELKAELAETTTDLNDTEEYSKGAYSRGHEAALNSIEGFLRTPVAYRSDAFWRIKGDDLPPLLKALLADDEKRQKGTPPAANIQLTLPDLADSYARGVATGALLASMATVLGVVLANIISNTRE